MPAQKITKGLKGAVVNNDSCKNMQLKWPFYYKNIPKNPENCSKYGFLIKKIINLSYYISTMNNRVCFLQQ